MKEREMQIEQKPSMLRKAVAGVLGLGMLAAAYTGMEASTVEVRQDKVTAEGKPCSPQDGNKEEICVPGSTMPDKESSTSSSTSTTEATTSTTEGTTTTEATTTTSPGTTTTTQATTTTSPTTTTQVVTTAPPARPVAPHVG